MSRKETDYFVKNLARCKIAGKLPKKKEHGRDSRSLPRSRFLGCHATLPQKKRLPTSELHSFLIVLAVCLRSFEQTNHVKMGLIDLRDSRCVSVVLIKAFLVLRLQACL